MNLKKTVDLMLSENYKERIIAEYQQLKIRHKDLINYLAMYKAGTLDSKPKSSFELLYEQADDMQRYMIKLQARAILENINLFSVEYEPTEHETTGTVEPRQFISSFLASCLAYGTTNAYLANDDTLKPVGKHHGVI